MEKKGRLLPLDLLRGVLIIIMALDHANFHIAHQHSSGEYWGGPFPHFSTPLLFLTRFITHVCAPGFFFLMGAGMALFAASRRQKGWKDSSIRWFFFARGLVLIACQGLLNLIQIWSYPGSPAPIFYGGVLAALGAGMILAIPLLALKPLPGVIFAVGLALVMELLTPAPPAWGRNFDNLAGVLLVYGGGAGEFWVNYPLLAWMEVIVLGLVFGGLFSQDENKAYRLSLRVGALFLAGFTFLRVVNGFGTIRPLQIASLQGFFSVVKYPPSIAFILLTMGLNLILIWAFSGLPHSRVKEWNPLLVFGRVPLFSYVGHLLIYFALGRLLPPSGTSLGIMYALWLAGLGILYYPARWYASYKFSQPPRSWSRFL
jgi:uncharacterized membrane protein